MKFVTDERLNLVPSASCNLSVAVINAQSLHCHLKDVMNHSSTQSSHIIGVTETFLMPTDAQSTVEIPNYNIYRKDRFNSLENPSMPTCRTSYTAHGGVAFYVHEQFHATVIDKVLHMPVEALAIIIQNRYTEERMCITITYKPPNQNLKSYLMKMDATMKHLPHLNIPTVIMGDFNVNLLQQSDDQKTILQFFRHYGFRQIVTMPTHNTGSLLDHIYCNFHIPTNIIPTNHATYFSQHSFIQIIFPQ